MSWFRRNKPQTVTVIHDPLCLKSPCICLALREERLERTRAANLIQRTRNSELAKKLLDAKNPAEVMQARINIALEDCDHNLARKLAGLPEYKEEQG